MEKYKLIKQIGRGTNGEVWLVKGTYSQKQYVLKQINLQHVSKREQRAAHLEVKLLSTLKHPNIVSYLDSFYNSKGSLFIVMGYCENGDLYTHIRNRKEVFPEKQIIEWLIQICMALKYLHDRKILHRDLKTQNIFLTRSKLIKIGDLGIARVLDATNDMATTLIGTPYYMSPEIFCSKPYNHKSDVWALGCCVYEMASLKHAFSAKNINSLMQKILQGKVSKLSEQYSKEFLEIVTSMLSHNPEDRPSVTEILLNSYIRSHIIKFLEETRNSSRTEPEKCNKLIKRESRNYDGSSSQPKKNGDLKNKENLLPKEKVLEKVKEHNALDAKEVVVAVPDINGNGDGNDNSQYRFGVNAEKIEEIGYEIEEPRCVEEITDQDSNQEKISLTRKYEVFGNSKLRSNGFQGRKLATHTNKTKDETNFQCEKITSTSEKFQEHRIKTKSTVIPHCTDKPKPKYANTNGQISLKFLQNLTYTIMKSSSISYTQFSKTHIHKSDLPFIGAHVPTLSISLQPAIYFDSCYPVQLSQPVAKLTYRSFNGSVITKENFKCPKICLQERIRNEPKLHQQIYNKDENHPLNLGNLKIVEGSGTDSDKEQKDPIFPEISHHAFPILNDDCCSIKSSNIDGCLLQQIITCDIKRTVPAHSNTSARQRRREQMCKGTRSPLVNSEFGDENLLTKGFNIQNDLPQTLDWNKASFNANNVTSLAF